MTLALACECDDYSIVVVTDSAVSYGDHRVIMPGSKLVRSGEAYIGTAGSDWAIMAALSDFPRKETHDPSNPWDLAEHIRFVARQNKLEDKIPQLDVEFLFVRPSYLEMNVTPRISIVTGEGAVYDCSDNAYACVGSGTTSASPVMDYAFAAKRCRKRTQTRVKQELLEVMRLTERYHDAVYKPFSPVVVP